VRNNRSLTALFLVIGACLVTGTAQQPTSGKLEDPPWIKERAAKRIVYSISSMNRVKVRNKNIPPMFIARAGLDDADLNAGLDHFVQIALSRNATLDLANHATGHHGFDVDDNNERSREIVKRTIEFIKAHSQ
jgi:hypothetical protein